MKKYKFETGWDDDSETTIEEEFVKVDDLIGWLQEKSLFENPPFIHVNELLDILGEEDN